MNGDRARSLLQDLSVEAFANREDLQKPLAHTAIRALRRESSHPLFTELGKNPRQLTRRSALVTALSLRRHLRDPELPERIGILLPPGSMPAVFHLALILAGKVPVHLPLSLLGREPERTSLLRDLGLTHILSSRALFLEQPYPDTWLDLRQTIASVTLADTLISRLEATWAPPSLLTPSLPKDQRDDEALGYVEETTLLPVFLSQRNILASIYQIDSMLMSLPQDRILIDDTFTSAPPLWFGIWVPILKENTALFRSLKARQVDPATLLRDQAPDMVLLSEDLREHLLSQASAWPTERIRLILDFLPLRLSERDRESLTTDPCEYCVGLAPSGCGAILSANTKDPNSMIPSHLPQTGNRPGTVGRLMPGVSVRIQGPQQEPLPLWETGTLLVRGSSLPASLPSEDYQEHSFHRLPIEGSFDRGGFLTIKEPASDQSQ
ncbi:MAG: hypothetical protein AAGJ31_06120, partial [Verrucomicrobiota bacterium]